MIEITATQTVGDKVVDLPVGSVVKVEVFSLAGVSMDYVLHRTGQDGWLTTRDLPRVVSGTTLKGYYNNDNIRKFIDGNYSSTVWLLTE